MRGLLFDAIDSWMVAPDPVEGTRDKKAFYPTEASCHNADTGQVVGSCLRQLYWRWKGEEASNPIEAGSWWVMEMGKSVEEIVTEKLSSMNVLVDNNVKFYDPAMNMSGEVDGFIWNFKMNKGIATIIEPRRIVGLEVKSAYGYAFYYAIKNEPKIEHVLQVMLYLKYWKKVPVFKILYIARDNPRENRAEYNITLAEGEYPVVEGKVWRHISIGGVIARWAILKDCLEKEILPDRDYKWNYTKEEVEDRYSKGLLTDKKYKSWKAGKTTVSDWQCNYCSYLNKCHPERTSPKEDTYEHIDKKGKEKK